MHNGSFDSIQKPGKLECAPPHWTPWRHGGFRTHSTTPMKNQWKFQQIHENSTKSMKIYENSINSRNIQEYP